jgi:Serine dehydrogenase proteinase
MRGTPPRSEAWMSKETRRELIKKIEEARGSRVITYITSDRQPVGGQFWDDALRPMYEQLRALGKVPKLDVFLYSRGGAIDVPWRLVTAFRQGATEWNILIPFRANSAATLTALGADTIVLGVHGELGPIDPIMTIRRLVGSPGQGALIQEQLNVEDVMAYMRFAQERGGLSDQAALTASLTKLTDKIDAVTLGNAYRTHSHIRDVARRVLLSRKEPANEQTLKQIVESLAEKVYAHGHAIGIRAAQEIGLPAEQADTALDGLMWDLFLAYEQDMKLAVPIDRAVAVANTDTYEEDATVAVIESATMTHEHAGKIEIRAVRQMPGNLQIAVNLNLQLPPGVNPVQMPANFPQVLQQLQPAIAQQAQQAVADAVRQQAPIADVSAAFRGGVWKRID